MIKIRNSFTYWVWCCGNTMKVIGTDKQFGTGLELECVVCHKKVIIAPCSGGDSDIEEGET